MGEVCFAWQWAAVIGRVAFVVAVPPWLCCWYMLWGLVIDAVEHLVGQLVMYAMDLVEGGRPHQTRKWCPCIGWLAMTRGAMGVYVERI